MLTAVTIESALDTIASDENVGQSDFATTNA
jgi:hypothetical protein